MKPQFVMYFEDSPHRIARDDRTEVAARLWQYRRMQRRGIVRLAKIGVHAYRVSTQIGTSAIVRAIAPTRQTRPAPVRALKVAARDKLRISAKSLPWLRQIDEHIRQCNIRGNLDRFRDVAADALDGHAFRSELAELIRRGLLIVTEYGFDDSMGRDDNRDRDQRLCGTSWSVNPTERLIRALWPDRLVTTGRKAAMSQTFRVTEAGPFWWRIEHVGDHYCGVVSGMVVCTVERGAENRWHVYNERGVWLGGHTGPGDALGAASKYCEERAK